ncbi:MAG: hypothetical protein IKO72_11505 [Kiritimatiellae bacterium]|nr:hypothetical protein [Kiritimatiellia bacterium]
MDERPNLTFAVLADVPPDNRYCMAGVTRVLPALRRLGVQAVLAGGGAEWRLVRIADDATFDLGAAVKAALEAKCQPLELVEEHGTPFLLCSTKELKEEDWKPFAGSGRLAALKKAGVFFYVQQMHPGGTVAGEFLQMQDAGFSTAALRGMRNCVAISSGALGPLVDERAIRQGEFGFTSVTTSSFRYPMLFPGRAMFPQIERSPLNRPSLVVSVFKDRVVFARMVLESSERLGPDWTMPLGDYGALSYERRAKSAKVPQFAAGAKPEISFKPGGPGGGAVNVTFPRALGADGSRAFDYEVTVHCMDGGVDGIVLQKRVYSPGIYLPPGKEPPKVTCPFLRNELYYDLPLVFEVRALNCFGAKGDPIAAQRTIKTQKKQGRS